MTEPIHVPKMITPVQLEIERKLGIPDHSLTLEKLKKWQLDRLNDTLAFCMNHSPFYKEKLADFSNSIPLRSLEELQQLPFTTSDDISEKGHRMVCTSQSQIERIVTLNTSGTTGTAKRIYFTKDDQQLTVDFFAYGMSTLISSHSKVLVLLPCHPAGSVGDLLSRAIRKIGAQPYSIGPFNNPDPINDLIASEKLDALVGAPKQVYTLVQSWKSSNRGSCPIQALLLSTDYASPILKKSIESAWNCDVLEHYGMTEAGLGVGVDCYLKRGYHLREADLYFELIDKDGNPVAEGEPGEVVFSTLTRHGMPLIRYRTKDISQIIPGECPCGTVLSTYKWISKRMQNEDSLCTIAELDNILFQIPEINGFDAAAKKESLNLKIYSDKQNKEELINKISESILNTFPGVNKIEIELLAGFPSSAFSLQKKKIEYIS